MLTLNTYMYDGLPLPFSSTVLYKSTTLFLCVSVIEVIGGLCVCVCVCVRETFGLEELALVLGRP